MPTITFDVGVTDLVVACQRAGKATKRRIGTVGYLFGGAAQSYVQDELMDVPLVLISVDDATALQVKTLFAGGAFVDCSGDVFNNALATVTCWGEYTDDMNVGETLRTPSLTLHQVRTQSPFAGFG